MAKYQANPVIVDAWKITKVGARLPGIGIQVVLETGSVITADDGMIARMTPAVGDYWVIQSDGYTYINPKDVFERKYEPVELNALELGAAVRQCGLAGE